jgi:2-polyprenyl-6-methoxyphenol hydroxylase-like FAD-dependent oxidoreductase
MENDLLARLRPRYIVGADGANSRVARQLNLDCNSEWIVGFEVRPRKACRWTVRLDFTAFSIARSLRVI